MGNGTRIGQVRGLGSSHHGAHHWLVQRVTGVGNLVSAGFLVISLALRDDFSYAALAEWAAQPIPALMLALLVISTFWHARLGLQVMVGCMVSTSLSMAPAVVVAQQASLVDLDGPLLLAEDRPQGLRYDGSELFPPVPALWG